MEGITVISNYQPREIIDGWTLTEKERAEFDYLDWEKIERGEDSASFVRYKGDLIDLNEFSVWSDPLSPLNERGWDAFKSDTFFSGLLVRYCAEDNFETVIMGRYYS